jgi:alpha-L-fucosidase
VRGTFQENLAARAKIKASNTRSGFDSRNLLDGDRYTYWATNDSVKTAEVEFTLPGETRFNVLRLRENIKLGQRIDAFEVDRWVGGKWDTFARATSIGACRLIRTDDITTNRVRLRITQAAACPAVSDFGLFLEAK